MNYSLEFDEKQYTVETVELEGRTLRYRAFENILYVKNPVDRKHQILSIYVPEAYYQGDVIGSFRLKTAPIFFPNTVGGYMPGLPERPGMNIYLRKPNAVFYALLRGYVVVSPGARGRGLKDEKGKYTGIAPACIVDLKAAIRYLRYNKNNLPGDTERIISNGTSAGGALSSLLGATGNHPDYEPYLRELGAAEERDDIYAASCYCPITNLEHADMAYEWEFYGQNDYHRMKFEMTEGMDKPKMTPVDGRMTDFQIQLSAEEKALFPGYLNSLGLKAEDGTELLLDGNGEGAFREYVKGFVKESVQRALETGTDLSELSWIKIQNGKVVDIDYPQYTAFKTRMKETPAFDSVSMGTPENELFGTADIHSRHFTKLSKEHSAVNGELAELSQIKLMNPMNYIGDKNSNTAKYYRIRHGLIDRDTSLAISAMLVSSLRNHGVDTDYRLPWGVPHSGDYDLEELFRWMNEICK